MSSCKYFIIYIQDKTSSAIYLKKIDKNSGRMGQLKQGLLLEKYLELGRNEKKSSFSRNPNKESSKVQGVCTL